MGIEKESIEMSLSHQPKWLSLVLNCSIRQQVFDGGGFYPHAA